VWRQNIGWESIFFTTPPAAKACYEPASPIAISSICSDSWLNALPQLNVFIDFPLMKSYNILIMQLYDLLKIGVTPSATSPALIFL
jgi:hypothetical protein